VADETIDSNPRPRDAGRAQRFDRLVGPLADAAYRLALTILRDADAADDAVQEAALKAWRRLDHLRSDAAARPWFFAIGTNF